MRVICDVGHAAVISEGIIAERERKTVPIQRELPADKSFLDEFEIKNYVLYTVSFSISLRQQGRESR